MSSKRVGLADRTVKPRLNVLFTPSETTEENTEQKTGQNIKPEPKTTESVKKNKDLKAIRQTYYMCPEVIEAIRILDFETREGISAIVNRILTENIPEETMKQAKNNIKRR